MKLQRRIVRIALVSALLGLFSLSVSFADELPQPQPQPQNTGQEIAVQSQSGQAGTSAGRRLGPTDGTGNQGANTQDGSPYGSPGRRQAGKANGQGGGNGSGKGAAAGQCNGFGKAAEAGKSGRTSSGVAAGQLTRSRARSFSGSCTGTGPQTRRARGSGRGGRR